MKKYSRQILLPQAQSDVHNNISLEYGFQIPVWNYRTMS